VIDYLVEKLRNRDLFIKDQAKVIKIIGKRVNGSNVGLCLVNARKGNKNL